MCTFSDKLLENIYIDLTLKLSFLHDKNMHITMATKCLLSPNKFCSLKYVLCVAANLVRRLQLDESSYYFAGKQQLDGESTSFEMTETIFHEKNRQQKQTTGVYSADIKSSF